MIHKLGFVILMWTIILNVLGCGEDAPSGPRPVSFTSLTANGAPGSVTTTALSLAFDTEPVGLASSDITVTGASKGILTGTGTVRTLSISGIAVGNGGSIAVELSSPSGYTITPPSRSVMVYVGPVGFTNITANGASGRITTTELVLSFNYDPFGMTIDDVTVTGATKVALSGTGMTRTVMISNISVSDGNTITVELVNPSGYVITPLSRIVAVYRNYRELISVPGGTYTQVPTSGNTFLHTITGFKIGKFEVNYELWYTVFQWAATNGYSFSNPGREGHDGIDGDIPASSKYEPVTMINWRDAIVWCNAYSQMEGLMPVYCSDSNYTTPIKDSSDGIYGSSINSTEGSFDNPWVNWDATGYRLPTEGEWQYAASYKDGSAWTPYDYVSGAAANYVNVAETSKVAWYSDNNSPDGTKIVGTKTGNALGIHDMGGNVMEFCWDFLDLTLPITAQTNYRGSAASSSRVTRGGFYKAAASHLQVGFRNGSVPYAEYDPYGFRIVRRQ